MTQTDYATFAGRLRRLGAALGALGPVCDRVGRPRPDGDEWFELLRGKLLPQMDVPAVLVVAIVGGTNIGKSVIFNHLAGEVASRSSPLAAGTKHPVALVPGALADAALLGRLFPSFELCPWRGPDDALADSPENRLFWRVGEAMPARLIVLDAPDVDSDVTVNWRRAEAIRQSADVVLAVLTQQKYNDAAVKRFFRAAVAADKLIVVVFNLCDLAADRNYWPLWLDTFSAETGARAERVYVVPHDRAAAEALRLPFYDVGRDGRGMPSSAGSDAAAATRPGSSASREPSAAEPSGEGASADAPAPTRGHAETTRQAEAGGVPNAAPASRGEDVELRPADLREDLARLHFDAIKIRTFRGALRRVLDPATGLPAHLGAIRAAAEEFRAAHEVLGGQRVRHAWPTLPPVVLVDEIRDWWDARRKRWLQRVHGAYRVLGRGIVWPLRAARDRWFGPAEDPIEAFRRRERETVVEMVKALLDELERLADVGNETLRPRLRRLLSGTARGELLERVERAHADLPPVGDDYRGFLRAELDTWSADNPGAVRLLQKLDHVLALARPAMTVTLFFTGLGFAGDVVGQAAAQTGGQLLGHLAAEAAIAGGFTAGGEALVSTTSEGVRQAAAQLFRTLQQRYGQQRAEWLARWLENQWLGELLEELRLGAEAPSHPVFVEVERLAAELAATASAN